MNSCSDLCPECGASIPIDNLSVRWCDVCEWNVIPESSKVTDPVDRAYAWLGKRFGKTIYNQAKKNAWVTNRATWLRIILYLAALAIHSFTFLLYTFGIYLLVVGWQFPVYIFGAVVCLGMGVVVRPRLGKWPEDVLERNEYPCLYSLVDRISQTIGAKRFDGIVIYADYRALCGSLGFRRRKVLGLGIPLLDILEPEEVVALIGHETAHCLHNDSSRSFFVGTAINTLYQWHCSLYPEYLFDPNCGVSNIFVVPCNIVMLLLSYVAFGLYWLMLMVMYRDTQLAEFRADILGAKVGGKQGSTGLLHKLHFGNTFDTAVTSFTLNKHDKSFLAVFKEHISQISPRELLRIKRAEEREGARLDVTHPPTVDRIKLINEIGHSTGQVKLSKGELATIKEELKEFYEGTDKSLRDQYLESLYGFE